MTYYVIVNDLIGGWCVSEHNKPLSEHDYQEADEVPLCDTNTKVAAEMIAQALNWAWEYGISANSHTRFDDRERAEAYVRWWNSDRIEELKREAAREQEQEGEYGIASNIARAVLRDTQEKYPAKLIRRKVSEWEEVQ